MEIEKLKEEIPFKWRVQSYSKKKKVAICVPYIDSRDAQDLLDKVCGAEYWQCKYYEVKGNVYCAVGISVKGEWIWKSDCGIESKEDGEKGEASDAFKRACVKWGVGRFLYSKDIKYPKTNELKTTSNYPNVVDDNGKNVWDITTHCNSMGNSPKAQPTNATPKKEELPWLNHATKEWKNAIDNLVTLKDVRVHYQVSKANAEVYENELTVAIKGE